MRKTLILISACALVPLTACDRSGDKKLADRVESAADNRAEIIESQADAMTNRADQLNSMADQVRHNGDARADAIKAADVNAKAMTKEERDAIVSNEAPAVR